MKILCLIIFLVFTYCWCKEIVTVVDLNPSNSPPEQDERTVLSLAENVELSIHLTFCLRFNLQDIISARYIFGIKDDKLALMLRFPLNIGLVKLKGESFYFKIPKDIVIRPFYWHHICISLNEEIYRVAVDGQQCSSGTHKITSFQSISFNQILMGSTYELVDLWGDNFKGELSELNIWSNSLSMNNLTHITKSCSHPKPVPDILQWLNITNSMLTGDNNHQRTIKQLCSQGKTEKSYHKLIPHLQDQDDAMKTCEVLNGQLASPKTLDEYKSWNVSVFGTECKQFFIASFMRMSNESWVDQNENIFLHNSLWSPGQPNGDDIQKCSVYNIISGKYYDDSCLYKACFVCSWKYQPLFTLRGLCAMTQLDTQFILRPQLEFDKDLFFYGVGKNNIIFDQEKHSWLIVEDKDHELIGPESTSVRLKNILGTLWLDSSDSHHTPVGTHKWNLTDKCNNVLPLKLTHCMRNEFTCNDGSCFELEKRCDHVFDCSDGSDEDNCEPLEIDEKNYRKTYPPFLRSHKTEVRLMLDIYSISKIDELANTFKGDVEVELKWIDYRIIFKNLAKSGNFLNRWWQDKIWLPPLYYSNTVDDVPISMGNLFNVKILKQGEPDQNDVSRINEENQFSGEENELHLTATDEVIFKCYFELSWFPFDVQHCSIDIRIPEELRSYTTLIPNKVKYTGEKVLNQFSIQEPVFHVDKNGSRVKAKFVLKRNPAFMIMNAYLPSFSTMAITIASLFLNEHIHFTTTIMLVLTSQLCLYTLFQSSLDGIPKTAYMKYIDYWNMSAMTVSLTSFFTIFTWEILQHRGIQSPMQTITRIAIPLITFIGVVFYWIMAGLLHFDYIK